MPPSTWPTCRAQALPGDKAAIVGTDKDATCFVGDGINDAPALATAGVGIAVGQTGSDAAAEAGDVILMGDPLKHLPLLLRLSRETLRVIRQNVVWFAFGVNLVGVAVTAWLWPLFSRSPDWFEQAPLAAAIYHQVGSLAVLLNSMRLLAFERPTNRRVRAVRRAVEDVDAWVGRLRVGDVLHDLTHRGRLLGAVVGAAAVAGLAWTCLVRIESDEVGVAWRFGAPAGELGPGLHLRWPWPVEAVTRVQPERVRSIEIGFRTVEERGKSLGAGMTWGGAHAEGARPVPDESLMVTGDGDLVELLATVRYRVDDARMFLTAAREPETALRSAAESSLRELVGGRKFDELLTKGRAALEADALAKTRRRLAGLGGVGVRVEGVTVHDLHPPPEVVAAYHDVAKAIQARDQQINEADALAARRLGRSREDAVRIVTAAETKAVERVGEERGRRDAFQARAAARVGLTAAEDKALWDETHSSGGWAAYFVKKALLGAERRRVHDYRLAWETIAEVLAGRDKVIVDAETVRGKRNLLLADPDWLRPLTPPRPATPADGK